MRVHTHPGEILKEEFLIPMELTEKKLAEAIKVPESIIVGIIQQNQGVNADIAMRFSRYFGTSAEFWCNLQSAYDLSLVALTKEKEFASIISYRQSFKMASIAVSS